MILGVPIIATFTGGTPSLLDNMIEGILYQVTETPLLAYYIEEIFNNHKLCDTLSNNAIKRASLTHDPRINFENLMNVYELITKGK